MIHRVMSLTASIFSLLLLAVLITIIITHDVNGIDREVITVDLPGQGLVQGSKTTTAWTNQTVFQFLGVPFAESPSGDLRFKRPVERAPWRHIHDATKFGLRCPVITTIKELSPELLDSDLEDCLNVCVYTKNVTAKRPVMFYIYGGGFYNGSSSDHPPKYLLEKDIVLVVTQYRVGAVGWLSTQTEEMPGNSPALDVILALQWVQKHIYAFGGDPSQVTIFSQSAGAAVTGMLLLSPKTPLGIFKRAIIQSGSIVAPWAFNNYPIEQTENICKKLECRNCTSKDEIYSCLRKLNILEILEATVDDSFSLSLNDFHGIMPHPPVELLSKYAFSYPILTGVTKHDGSFVLASFYDAVKVLVGNVSLVAPREFASKLFGASNEPDTSGLAKNLVTALLFNATDLDGTDHHKLIPAYIDLASDTFIKSPVFTFAKQMAKKGTTYLYTFDYEGQWTRFGYEFGNDHYPFNGGAHHSNDNIYVFSTHNLNTRDTEMAKKMVDIWTSFAIDGIPYTKDAPHIMPLQSETGPYFRIDEMISIGRDFLEELQATINDPDKEKFIRHEIEF